MIDLSSNSASISKQIPIDKMLDADTAKQYSVSKIVWKMSLKPGIRDVATYNDGHIRVEEIEVFEVEIQALSDEGRYLQLLKNIHSKVMYPCVVLLKYKNKYKIIAWKTIDSVASVNKELLKTPFVSSWIYEPPASEKTAKCSKAVEDILCNGTGDLKNLYDQICSAISFCQPEYIGSRAHLIRLIVDLGGAEDDPILSRIDYIKQHDILNPQEKYKKNRYSQSFKYSYEYEDIWYALMNDDRLKQAIINRRYEDMNELVFKIDMKYWENETTW